MNEDNKHILLYAHNIPIAGEDRGAIYDLQAGRLLYVPNILITILENCRKISIRDIIKEYCPQCPDILMKYFNYLFENNWAFITKHPESYPQLNLLNNETPNIIYNAILESGPFLNKALTQLEDCCCWYVEFRIKELEDVKYLYDYLSIVESSSIKKYQIVYFFKKNNIIDDITNHCKKDARFAGIIAYTDLLNINKNKMYINLPYFLESIHYDTYKYKKIFINKFGNIYNTPESPIKLGNIQNSELRHICQTDDYHKLSKRINSDSLPTRYAIFYNNKIK